MILPTREGYRNVPDGGAKLLGLPVRRRRWWMRNRAVAAPSGLDGRVPSTGGASIPVEGDDMHKSFVCTHTRSAAHDEEKGVGANWCDEDRDLRAAASEVG